MTKNFQDRLKCTGLHKLQHCLGARGKGGEINSQRVNCLKSCFPHCTPVLTAALEKSPKSAQVVLDFYKRCLKFRNTARKLLAATFLIVLLPSRCLYIFLFSLIIKITISSIVIGLKNSFFPLIHSSSCHRTICSQTTCYRTIWLYQLS